MGTNRLDTDSLERYDSLFVAPMATTWPSAARLACWARRSGPARPGPRPLRAGRRLGPRPRRRCEARRGLCGGGPSAARQRRAQRAPSTPITERGPEDEDVALEAARLLTDVGPRTQAVHVYAPLGLGPSVDHALTYEAAARAFATESGRNLFLYEERPEAFVPGEVRTRLAPLGARLPAGAAKLPERAGLLRHLWRLNEPSRLRGEGEGIGARLRAMREARRRFLTARPWNPLRAFGPRLQPIVHVADEEARERARTVVRMLLPRDDRALSRPPQLFDGRPRRRRSWWRLPRRAVLAVSPFERRPARGPAPPGDGRGLNAAQLPEGSQSSAVLKASQRSASCSQRVLR
jgi:hypothetical protein